MHYFELFQNIAFTNVLFDGRSLKFPREEYLEKIQGFTQLSLASPPLIKNRKENLL